MSVKLPTSEQVLFAANVLADKLFFGQKYSAGIKKIIIVKWDEIGDMATSTHVFEILRKNYPESEITLLCKPFVKSLIACDKNIDKVITRIADFNTRYDLVVELRGTWTTLFKSLFYKAKYRVSRAGVRARNKGRQLHEIDTNYAVVYPMLNHQFPGIRPALYFCPNDIIKVDEFLNKNCIGKFAILHVGARRILRQWPLDRFALIATYLKQQFQLDIVFAGTTEDDPQIEFVKKGLNFDTYSFTDGFSLSEFSSLCNKASFYIGNESGPLHIASVFNIPLIGLYGPGVPDVFYPTGENSVVIHHVLKCNPCNQIDCVQPENPCINLIGVTDVMNKILQIGERINL